MNVRGSVFTNFDEDVCVFSGTIHADSNDPERLATSLLALMGLFPDTANSLHVHAIPCPIVAAQLSNQDLWRRVFDACPFFKYLKLDARMDMSMKRAAAAAFLAHAAKQAKSLADQAADASDGDSTSDCFTRPNFNLRWPVMNHRHWDCRTRVPVCLSLYAEELSGLVEVVSQCPSPDRFSLTVEIEYIGSCFGEGAKFINLVKRIATSRETGGDADVEPDSDSVDAQHEKEVLTQLRRLSEIPDKVELMDALNVFVLKRKWEWPPTYARPALR
ncbi:hypothetical protein C8Q76DRAFT_732669 [Earliella scabrosa]|nr:hypothetical protein C8Q76DRAFT_732669 [Earliella scabrosa]